MIKPFFTSSLIAAFFAAAPAGAETASPFGYPSTTLDAPATFTEPVGEFVRFGREPFFLGSAGLRDAAERFHAARLREGAGYFERDFACFAGTEGGRPMIVWLIATASSEITEAQIEWVKDEREVPRTCGRLEARNLPVRLGLAGLGMTEKEVAEHIGKPSHEDGFGWKFWFSQRFLKNARGLEELELNWVGLKFKDGRVDRGFASFTRNP